MINIYNVMVLKGFLWSLLKNSVLKLVWNIFFVVYKLKCVYEYINKNSINKNNNDIFKDDFEMDVIFI